MSGLPTRKLVRLRQYDYATPGCYVVTICTFKHHNLLDRPNGEHVVLSNAGHIAERCWLSIPRFYPEYELDLYVIMPNHIHGLLLNVPSLSMHENAQFLRRPLGRVIRAFKAAVTRQSRQKPADVNTPMWQRGFYEHIIRDERDLLNTRQYILNNPLADALNGAGRFR